VKKMATTTYLFPSRKCGDDVKGIVGINEASRKKRS
jgi:hypothetical protein